MLRADHRRAARIPIRLLPKNNISDLFQDVIETFCDALLAKS
jgi:hypothetical protein